VIDEASRMKEDAWTARCSPTSLRPGARSGSSAGRRTRCRPLRWAQQQSSTTSEPIHYVHIHKGRGDHIKTTIDGEVVEDRMGGMPASMPSSAPLAVARVPSGISAPSVRARRSLATPG
jgi:hypothetical protein